MKLRTGYIFSLLGLAFIAWTTPAALAQVSPDTMRVFVPEPPIDSSLVADSLYLEEDMEDDAPKVVVIDTTARFGVLLWVDYGKLITLATDFETKYEFGGGFVFMRRIVLEAMYGSAELNPQKAYRNTEFYTIRGSYYKASLQYRLALNPSIPRNFIGMGAGYGLGSYRDEGRFLIESDVWGSYDEVFRSDNFSASWAEVFLTSESYINKKTTHFLVGIKASLRVMLNHDNRSAIPVYAVPGYGRTFDKSTPAVNFYLKYILPF